VLLQGKRKAGEGEAMREMKTIDAVGQVLCQDITQIIPGVKKGPIFRKGHRIEEADIPVLLSVGKDHIYIWDEDAGILHENEAAEILYRMGKGENMHPGEIKEGKVLCTESNCNNQICVRTPAISEQNSDLPIVCLPHGLIIQIITNS